MPVDEYIISLKLLIFTVEQPTEEGIGSRDWQGEKFGSGVGPVLFV